MYRKVAITLFALVCFTELAKAQQPENWKPRLDSLFTWFRQHPASDTLNYTARRQKSTLLDKYGWMLSAAEWKNYRQYWQADPQLTAQIEAEKPVLYYLRKSMDSVLREVKTIRVTRGVVLWKCYNMGYIVKTKDACFGIDINQPGSTQLADVLDFLIVSHGHDDHYNLPLLEAMTRLGKPVYTPFYKKGTLIDTTRTFRTGEVQARFTMNMQAETPVIVSQIDCGPSANHFTIYHIGDARLLERLTPDRPVNLLVLHIQNALDVFAAVKKIQPRLTVYDHVMELGHAVGAYRWSYDYTYNKIKDHAANNSWVLTWGERLNF